MAIYRNITLHPEVTSRIKAFAIFSDLKHCEALSPTESEPSPVYHAIFLREVRQVGRLAHNMMPRVKKNRFFA